MSERHDRQDDVTSTISQKPPASRGIRNRANRRSSRAGRAYDNKQSIIKGKEEEDNSLAGDSITTILGVTSASSSERSITSAQFEVLMQEFDGMNDAVAQMTERFAEQQLNMMRMMEAMEQRLQEYESRNKAFWQQTEVEFTNEEQDEEIRDVSSNAYPTSIDAFRVDRTWNDSAQEGSEARFGQERPPPEPPPVVLPLPEPPPQEDCIGFGTHSH